jgi:hypothetical protein
MIIAGFPGKGNAIPDGGFSGKGQNSLAAAGFFGYNRGS